MWWQPCSTTSSAERRRPHPGLLPRLGLLLLLPLLLHFRTPPPPPSTRTAITISTPFIQPSLHRDSHLLLRRHPVAWSPPPRRPTTPCRQRRRAQPGRLSHSSARVRHHRLCASGTAAPRPLCRPP
ncbi:proline-rich receptor-like protein kinase PERK9 [Iris pallida]|uniref:Proline-rich receptor-like protein kinase PERK9 n=1 Tax=Iris pallida TaxID=29817 RepID=A0AAX6EV94_IRIPA|nr:proline-rich receptor-like protein kinase PERK9 [Iris pallida]